MEIVRAFWIDTFVKNEMSAFFLCHQSLPAVRAQHPDGSGNKISGTEGLGTDFAPILSITAIVIVEKVMGCTAQRTDNIFRDRAAVSALNRLNGFAILPEVVFQEKLPVLFDKGSDVREFVNFEFLILWGVGIVKAPLLEWDVSADKTNQPAFLLVKILNNRK